MAFELGKISPGQRGKALEILVGKPYPLYTSSNTRLEQSYYSTGLLQQHFLSAPAVRYTHVITPCIPLAVFEAVYMHTPNLGTQQDGKVPR